MSQSTGKDGSREPVAAVAAGGAPAGPPEEDPGSGAHDRQRVLDAEKAEFGRMQFFTAFFGWLTATGTVVLLTAVVTGIGAAAGLGSADSATASSAEARTAGIAGSIVLAVVILIGYFAGGYVAARMARFSGLKQGLAVWLWLIIITVVVGIAGAVVGSRFNVFAQLGSVPNLGNLTAAGVIAAVAAAVLALIGALLGGLSGMRYHRRVDRTGIAA